MGPRSITVVMECGEVGVAAAVIKLQWVHGRITVVMEEGHAVKRRKADASMGPRSDNRGYADAVRNALVAHV